MKIRITMVSGSIIDFENDMCDNIERWMNSNIKVMNGWFMINKDSKSIIRIENIERIEEI